VACENPHLSPILYFLHTSYIQIFPLSKTPFPNNLCFSQNKTWQCRNKQIIDKMQNEVWRWTAQTGYTNNFISVRAPFGLYVDLPRPEDASLLKVKLWHWVTGSAQLFFLNCLTVADCVLQSSEMSATSCPVTQCHIPEDLCLWQYRYENLKPHIPKHFLILETFL